MASTITALHFSCVRGNWEILNLLLKMYVLSDV